MKKPKVKKIIVPGVSIWPQPKKSPRTRYRISYGPRHKRVTLIASTDMETTVELAMRISRTREQHRTGIINADDHRHLEEDRRPIAEHLADWTKAMTDSALGEKHVRQFSGYARDVLLGSRPLDPLADRGRGRARAVTIPPTGWRRISEIIQSKVRNQVGAVKRQSTGATANRYLDAVTAFLSWGVVDGRWSRNVCEHLERYNARLDRKRHRRVLSAQQIVQLLEATEAGPVRSGLSGKERSLVYRTCLAAALRRNEARTLPVHDAKLEGSAPGLWVSEKVGKNKRKRHFIPISESLAVELAAAAAGKRPTEPLMVVPSNTARMIKQDLEAAELEYQTADGVFDFHGLRHECGALMISAGASPKAVQEHMRHASIRMTLDTYGHLLPEDREQARRRLPGFEAHDRPAIAAAAGIAMAARTPAENAQRNAQRKIGSNCRQMSSNVGVTHPHKEPNMRSTAEKQRTSKMEPRGIEPRFAECDSVNHPAEAKSQAHLTGGSKPRQSATRSARPDPAPDPHRRSTRKSVRITRKVLASGDREQMWKFLSEKLGIAQPPSQPPTPPPPDPSN